MRDCARLTLWSSRDNGAYSPLRTGSDAHIEMGPTFRMRWDGLDTEARFFALTCTGDTPPTFGNTLRRLVEVRDSKGRPLPITFSRAVQPARHGNSDFRVDGFAMDVPGHSLDDFHFVDMPSPIAFGIGRQRHLAGALCPAYPEVRDWWLQHVDDCIAAGVDGLDFRMHNHNCTFEWDAYGCSPPVIAAFRDRFGIDIREERFDPEALRRLRGAFYNDFLQKARFRLREARKTMVVHIDLGCYPPSRWPTYMELRLDWRAWIEADMVDEITFKSHRHHRSTVPLEITEWLRTRTQVRINACPWLNRLVNLPSGPDELAYFIRDVQAIGADSYILYENRSIMKAGKDGTVELTHPWVLADLSRHAASEP